LPAVGTLLALAASGCGADSDATPAGTVTVLPAPADTAPATPARSATLPAPGHLSVHVLRPTRLRAAPGGQVAAKIAPRTEFRSPTVLPVVAQRGDWYAVISPALPNGQVGWVSTRAELVPYATDVRIAVSLSRRQVVVRRAGRTLARFPVAVGGPSTPTPTGRFAVTDKLLTEDPGSPYGCCVLALSAHQSRVPQGWGGGDRIALHATNLPGTIGTAASLGCLRAPEAVVRRLVHEVPLGTVVTIRP